LFGEYVAVSIGSEKVIVPMTVPSVWFEVVKPDTEGGVVSWGALLVVLGGVVELVVLDSWVIAL
jgi:hypothetical protein